jgi:hypothetical protein
MTHEEMERTLVRLAELQQDNHALLRESLGALGKLNGLVIGFAEHTETAMSEQHRSLLRVESAVESLTRQVEAFVRGSHNGGKQ